MRAEQLPTLAPHIPLHRGTSVQVCGLWPFAAEGNGTPSGAPLGRHHYTGAPVCCDPIAWFEDGLVLAPSMFVLGLNGLGKSSLIRHMALGMAGRGINCFVLGDLKPDYCDLVQALGGQIISVGPGRSKINPLDAGGVSQIADRLPARIKQQLLADAEQRTLTMVSSLIHLVRHSEPSERETTILKRAIKLVQENITDRQPVLSDLIEVIQQGPSELRQAAIDRDNFERYQDITESLEASLFALVEGQYGEVFAGETTTRMLTDRSVVFDISAVASLNNDDLLASVLLACWSYGFATIEAHQALADAGIIARQRFFVIMDELWRILRASSGMVQRIDALTRLNRGMGVGQAMCTHTMADMTALAAEDAAKAQGFVERSKIVMLGGLPRKEMPLLREVLALSGREQELLTSWQDPGAPGSEPPGLGRFLIKAGNRPGVPFRVQLTKAEIQMNNTNQRWDKGSNGTQNT